MKKCVLLKTNKNQPNKTPYTQEGGKCKPYDCVYSGSAQRRVFTKQTNRIWFLLALFLVKHHRQRLDTQV